MKTHDRYAVGKRGLWLLRPTPYGPTWTDKPQFAWLYIRRSDAVKAAERVSGVVVPVEIAFG